MCCYTPDVAATAASAVRHYVPDDKRCWWLIESDSTQCFLFARTLDLRLLYIYICTYVPPCSTVASSVSICCTTSSVITGMSGAKPGVIWYQVPGTTWYRVPRGTRYVYNESISLQLNSYSIFSRVFPTEWPYTCLCSYGTPIEKVDSEFPLFVDVNRSFPTRALAFSQQKNTQNIFVLFVLCEVTTSRDTRYGKFGTHRRSHQQT